MIRSGEAGTRVVHWEKGHFHFDQFWAVKGLNLLTITNDAIKNVFILGFEYYFECYFVFLLSETRIASTFSSKAS